MRGDDLSTDALRRNLCTAVRRGAIVFCATTLFVAMGCFNVITASDEAADDYAQFKATGGRCEGSAPEPVTLEALGEAVRYRSLLLTGVLDEVVSPAGRVYYNDMLDDAELSLSSSRLLDELASVDTERFVGYEDQLAFWLNTYNTLVLVAAYNELRENPMFRVDLNGFEFFDRRVHNVGGLLLSLNEIEHGVIRGAEFHPAVFFLDDADKALLLALHDQMNGERPLDVRIHFAVNCASASCPELLPRAYSGRRVLDELEAVTHAFLNDEVKGASAMGISQLFDFYYDDFEMVEGGRAGFIAQYRSLDEVNLDGLLPYDWSLNLDVRDAPMAEE